MNWELLPSRSPLTVDGYWGGMELEEFYAVGPFVFEVSIYTDQEADRTRYAPTYEFQGKWTNWSQTIVKRNVEGAYYDFWNISASIEEI